MEAIVIYKQYHDITDSIDPCRSVHLKHFSIFLTYIASEIKITYIASKIDLVHIV